VEGRASEVRRLFERAIELSPGEREGFLSRLECSEDVRARVRALLAGHDRAGSFLESPPVEWAVDDAADPGGGLVGSVLGGYRVTGVLGEGGMGVVYRAEQEHPRRAVALKLIRSPLAGREALSRFRREAEALGRLNHRGIAQVYEAGEARDAGGRSVPFVAMELVEGVTILEYARERGLDIPSRLALFAEVCDAVQHAHQRGVIHRDLKPGNILVEDRAEESAMGSGVRGLPGAGVKVLDFGVARLSDDAGAGTLRTDAGQVIGTLAYMSPEQVRGEASRADTRSDVYALGVVLYELLTGRPPYETRGKPLAEAARVIEEEDPTPPASVMRALRGDAETIVLKALEKEPERRYESAAALSADIRRSLGDLPIVARPTTAAYQLRKFAQRNRALVGGVVATFLALAGGIVGTSVGLVRSNEARRRAEVKEGEARTEARKSRRAIEFLVGMLTSADPDATGGKDPTVRVLLDRSAAGVGEELKDDPEVQLSVRDAIGRTYRAAGDPARGAEHFLAARMLAEAEFGPMSPEVAEVVYQTALCRADQGDWPAAKSAGLEALGLFEKSLGPNDPRIAACCAMLGGATQSLGELDASEAFGRRALDIATKAGAKGEIASASGLLAELTARRGGKDAITEADGMHRLQVATLSELHGPGHSRTLLARSKLAYFLGITQRDEDAAVMHREVIAAFTTLYGPLHRRTLTERASLATALLDLGKTDEAAREADGAIEGLRAHDPRSLDLSSALSIRGVTASRQKDHAKAVACHREAMEIREEKKSVNAVTSMANLAGALRGMERYSEAAEVSLRAIEARRASATVMTDFGVMLSNHGDILGLIGGRDDEAERFFKESLAFDQERRPDNPANALNIRAYVAFLCKRQRFAEAEPLAREAWAMTAKLSAAARARVADAVICALEGVGKAEEAAAIRRERDAAAQGK
jgi:non-specific serine/threonine protein kinase/serine/threonine-protein kinase